MRSKTQDYLEALLHLFKELQEEKLFKMSEYLLRNKINLYFAQCAIEVGLISKRQPSSGRTMYYKWITPVRPNINTASALHDKVLKKVKEVKLERNKRRMSEIPDEFKEDNANFVHVFSGTMPKEDDTQDEIRRIIEQSVQPITPELDGKIEFKSLDSEYVRKLRLKLIETEAWKEELLGGLKEADKRKEVLNQLIKEEQNESN